MVFELILSYAWLNLAFFIFEERETIWENELLEEEQLRFLNMGKTITVTGTEVTYTNRLLTKLYLLRKIFILDIHFFFYSIMQQTTLFTQKMRFKFKIGIKVVGEKNRYCAMAGLKKKGPEFRSLWISWMIRMSWFQREFSKSWKKGGCGQPKS